MKLKYILLLIVLLIVDQASKFGIHAGMELHESFVVIPGFFDITYLQNTGAAWSMLEGNMIFFYIISVIALVIMIYFFRSVDHTDTLTKYGIVCMMAGTIGNLIDRVLFQYVRDFFDFNIFGYDFPVFNVADMALCFGVFLIFLSVFLESYGGFRKCAK